MIRDEQVCSKKILLRIVLLYWAIVVVSFFIARNSFNYSDSKSESVTPFAYSEELTDGIIILQIADITTDDLNAVELLLGTYGRYNTGKILVKVLNPDSSEILSTGILDISTVEDYCYNEVSFDTPVKGYKGQSIIIEISSVGCSPGNAVTLYYGNSINTGRVVISADVLDLHYATINGNQLNGQLCIKLIGRTYSNATIHYWIIASLIFAVGAIYTLAWGWKGYVKGKHNAIYVVCAIMGKYSFLLKQLVIRDFKVKYKRSVLGVAWSFLNPLLTMLVQYMIFSTLFRSNIDNYGVYLLIGIIFFNYFSETVSLGMTSITGNSTLINKVYLPKYIYPVSKVLSSLVNFTISLIPLILVIVITGTRLHLSIILLAYDLICFIGFVTGMVLILSTLMVFFRDVQFLWSVLSMVWMYMTPIFYPATIIPEKYFTLYKMNPLYQYITFARTLIIDGVSPVPESFLYCLFWSFISLFLGIMVFKKEKEKFVLYI